MRKNSSEFKTYFISEPGTFRSNKDYFAFVELDDMACWIAADGIDSDEEQKSAEIVTQSIFAEFMEAPTFSRRKLKKYLSNAHNILKAESRNVRLKASLVMVVTDYSKLVWVVSGNSRLYHFRKKRFHFKSKDQSIAQLMEESGKINEDELNVHEERNNLTNYLGTPKNLSPFVSRKFFLNDGDVFLLCTAGFWENANNVEVVDLLKVTEEPGDFVDGLEEVLLGKQNDTLNNYTVAAVFVNKTFKDNAESKNLLFQKFTKFAMGALIAGLILFVMVFFVNKQFQVFKARQTAIAEQQDNEVKGDQLVKEGEYHQALEAYEKSLTGFNLVKNKGNQEKKMLKGRRLNGKYDLTKLLVEADENFAAKKYQMALSGYLNASVAIEGLEYDRKKLDLRIEKVKGYIGVLDLVSQADADYESGNYEDAKQKYARAANLAEKFSYQEMLGILNEKLMNTTTKVTETKEKETKANSAKRYVAQGNQKYYAKKYKEAIDFYTLAKGIFEELTLSDEVMILQNKIQECEKRERQEEAKKYEKQGDDKYTSKKYKEAINLYGLAREIYVEFNMSADVLSLDNKIKQAERKDKRFIIF